MTKNEVFVSIDIEADGPAPGLYSMLALGAAAFRFEGGDERGLVDTFSANLDLLPGAAQHPDTMAWWQTQPAAWALVRQDPEEPDRATLRFDAWLQTLPGKPIAVGYPAAYDFQWLNYYLHRFVGRNRLGHSALDIKSYAMAVLRERSFSATTKRRMPRHWFAGTPRHTHVPVDDAIEQGMVWLAMAREWLGNT